MTTRYHLRSDSTPQTAGGSPLVFDDTSLLLLKEDIGETYQSVVLSAAAAVGAELCSLALYDADTDEILARRPRYSATGGPVPQYPFPLQSSRSSRRVVQTGEPYLSNQPGSDPLYDPSIRDHGIHSVLTVPVRRGNRILGLLYALNKPGGFAEDDVRTLTALAGAAAITLENIRLYSDERERRLLNEGLREVSRALVSTPTEDAALAAVLDQMWRVVRYDAAAAVLVEGDRLRVAASRGGEASMEVPLTAVAELRSALETHQAGVLVDPATTFVPLGMPGPRGEAVIAPLLAKGEILGGILVGFDVDRPLTPRDRKLVEAFADHAALFLDAAAILRRERLARARAATLARITRLAATRHEPESLLQAVAPELVALSGADRAVLYLKHPRSQVLIPTADSGVAPDEEERARELRLDMSVEPLVELLRAPRPLAFHVDRNPPPTAIAPFPDTQSLLVLPLVSHGDLVGAALLVRVGRARPFDPPVIEFVNDVVQQVALGVENARLFSRLAQMASTDELTGLANRRRFAETFRVELSRARRNGAPLALVMADVDHLKRINDSFGHPAGDAAIRHVADALRRGRRETDLAARLGGEEFALLLAGTDLTGAITAAERIRQELSTSTVPPAGMVTVSLGIATFPDDGQNEEDLVRAADERLYAAKAAGRNRVFYSTVEASLRFPPSPNAS